MDLLRRHLSKYNTYAKTCGIWPRCTNVKNPRIISKMSKSVLLVLGIYHLVKAARSDDLDPFLAPPMARIQTSVCAFGLAEAACLSFAMKRSGRARTGFENNFSLPDGTIASYTFQAVSFMRKKAISQGLALRNHLEPVSWTTYSRATAYQTHQLPSAARGAICLTVMVSDILMAQVVQQFHVLGTATKKSSRQSKHSLIKWPLPIPDFSPRTRRNNWLTCSSSIRRTASTGPIWFQVALRRLRPQSNSPGNTTLNGASHIAAT